jgi:hypothetical protein
MWEAIHKINQVTTAVDKVIPFSNGAVLKSGTECTIENISSGKARVRFCDFPKCDHLFLEYEISELNYESEITNVVWKDE